MTITGTVGAAAAQATSASISAAVPLPTAARRYHGHRLRRRRRRQQQQRCRQARYQQLGVGSQWQRHHHRHRRRGSGGSNDGIDIINSTVSITGSGALTLTGTAGAGPNSYGIYVDSSTISSNTGDILAIANGDFYLGAGTRSAAKPTGNAIVVSTSGSFIDDSGSSSPFSASNGRFIGYSYKELDDPDPVTAQQQIIGYTYGTLATFLG